MRVERFGQSPQKQHEYLPKKKKSDFYESKENEVPQFEEYGDKFKKSMDKIHEKRKDYHATDEVIRRKKSLAEGEDEMEVRRKKQQWVDAPEKKK